MADEEEDGGRREREISSWLSCWPLEKTKRTMAGRRTKVKGTEQKTRSRGNDTGQREKKKTKGQKRAENWDGI
ncbi:hypothetical protein OIU85_028192 [Salix viminalis]|uniref:Uncharacterized protein n=1 Tax=Salix viminalis TaxID=40686 RepID=A0A9Q0QKX0_SALVM|nr:hypothetical protein OIU85_028192 [Salix viminalis]